MRRIGVILLAGTVVGALLAGTGAAQLPSVPSLTAAELLELAQVEAPPAGIGLEIHADFPKGSPLVLDGVEIQSLTADLTPEGSVIMRNVVTADSLASTEAGVGECDDPAFLPTGVRWAEGTMPIGWNLDLGSTPEELKGPRTTLTVRTAHRIWPRAKTICDKTNDNSFSYDYLGPKIDNPAYDDVNIVDFGRLGNKALAVNYTWYEGRGAIVDVDLRLNKIDYLWTNMDGVHRFNVKNVVAHELGHQFGLDDLGAPHNSLTMYALIEKGELNKATLGRGDMRGAETLSP